MYKRLTHLLASLVFFGGANFVFALPAETTSSTLQVGPQRALTTPSAAAEIARSGDTIEIDAGIYANDYAVWRQEDLTIRGVGGHAHLQSSGLIPNGKAIWVIAGDNIVLENIEFSGAKVIDTNGAGIRHEAGNLTLRNTYFHHNEFSILTGDDHDGALIVEDSRFHFQERPGHFSHGLYVGVLKLFSISGSHIMGTDRGHQIKSRALENHIRFNRIEDIPGGNSSRLVDLPNCGLSFIVGNDLHQAETTHNVDAIGYGAEGCADRNEEQKRLFVVNNTFVNEAWNGALVRNHVGGQATVLNNLAFGRGSFLLGRGTKTHNYFVNLSHRGPGGWLPPARTKAVDGSYPAEPHNGAALLPDRVFAPPVGTAPRLVHGKLDAGAREVPL